MGDEGFFGEPLACAGQEEIHTHTPPRLWTCSQRKKTTNNLTRAVRARASGGACFKRAVEAHASARHCELERSFYGVKKKELRHACAGAMLIFSPSPHSIKIPAWSHSCEARNYMHVAFPPARSPSHVPQRRERSCLNFESLPLASLQVCR